ncbi:MAG: c-type cytochrome [Solirubrobacteraceae bacterium]
MTRRFALSLLVMAWTAAAATGCASSRSQTQDAPSGRVVFARACRGCHTLTGHNDARHQGGDLLGFHSTRPQMLQLAREMPVRHPLSPAQLQAVVRFVMAVEAGRP